MRIFAVAAMLSVIPVAATAQDAATADPLATSLAYIGVNGLPACPAGSNADKINKGEDLGDITIERSTFDVKWPNCPKCISHALMITNPSVVDAAVTEWSLRHLLDEIAGAAGPGDAIQTVIGSMRVDQVIHSFDVPMRPDVEKIIVQPWIAAAGVTSFSGLVDRLNGKDGTAGANAAWDAAPFRLLSIGYRPDLLNGNFAEKRVLSGGEGRFIFQAVGQNGQFIPMLLIFEYELPATLPEEAIAWAEKFHKLTTRDFGEAYNAALREVTMGFTNRNVKFSRPNNNMLSQLRTNELAGPPTGPDQWELREFRITHAGRLEPATVQMNPDLTYNSDPGLKAALVDYILGPEFIGSFPQTTIPWSHHGAPFLAGSSITPAGFVFGPPPSTPGERPPRVDTWLAGEVEAAPEGEDYAAEIPAEGSPVLTEAIRHRFASTTCNGCHGGDAIRSVGLSDKIGEEAEVENRAIASKLVPHDYFLTGFTHVDARADRPGHQGGSIMSEFMCESDLVARAAVLRGLVDAGTPAAMLVAENAAQILAEEPQMAQAPIGESALEMSLFAQEEFRAAAEAVMATEAPASAGATLAAPGEDAGAADDAVPAGETAEQRRTVEEVVQTITLGTSIIYRNQARPH
jgi:hypothetical protein